MKRVFKVGVYVVVHDDTVDEMPDEIEPDMESYVFAKAQELLAKSTPSTDYIDIEEITDLV